MEKFFSEAFYEYLFKKLNKKGDSLYITIQEKNKTISQWKFLKEGKLYKLAGGTDENGNYDYTLEDICMSSFKSNRVKA